MGKSLKVYMALVNRIPGIQERYQKYREQVHGAGRMKAWGYLMKLNLQYYVLRRHDLQDPLFLSTDKEKKLYPGGGESSLSVRENPEIFAQKLVAYDVISFDVFDTLILRSFARPTDLFFMVGQKLGYPDFERIRREMEQKARKRKYQQYGHTEVTFEEIWEVMEEETGISAAYGARTEWETELQYCFANPYFAEIVRILQEKHKKMIITSDMYLHREQIRELLQKAGYPEFSGYYVSCEYGCGKGQGTLYQIVKQNCGQELKYAHIGDNAFSDQKRARESGFDAYPYQNVNTWGEKFRSEDMSAILGSMYRGIINAHLHNGLNRYSMAYEFGFVYAGLFVLGYCQFIHEYAKMHQTDKILFLARDGDILNQVYQMLYPAEKDCCQYVYWSRLAATKMSAKYFKYDYFRRFLYHKVNQGYTLKQIFASMELPDMLEGYLAEASGKREETTVLTLKEADAVKKYLIKHWEEVLRHYEEQLEVGKSYYSQILGGCRHAVAVDVGWAGSGAVSLDYIVNQIWGLNCEIIGLLAGTNSAYNTEPDSSEAQMQNGKLVSFLFSQSFNRDVWKEHNPGKGHNIVVELLLASDHPSFRGFTRTGNGLQFAKKTKEIDSVQVQKGVLDFVRIFCEHFGEEVRISGRDCMAPILLLYRNEEWLKQVIHEKDVILNLE